jgi:hypothetical protein
MIAGLLILTLASVVACHLIARARGGNAVYWGVMGLLFGPFAIPFALRAKPIALPAEDREGRE